MSVLDIWPVLFESYFIKIIFLVHTLLASLVTLAIANNGSLSTYVFYNLLFLLALLLAILVDKNTDIILIACLLNVIDIVLDVILLLSGWHLGVTAVLLIIVNLVCRPLSSIMLLKNWSSRAGIDDPTSGLLEVHVQAPVVPQARSAYQNIDEPNQTLP